MSRIGIWMMTAVVAVMLLMPAVTTAQETKAPAPAAVSDEQAGSGSAISDWIKASKQPVSWLKWGADVRIREIFTANLLLNREDRHFQRYRFRTWATVTPIENVDINFRLVWEPRHYCQPARRAETRSARYIDEWTMNEAIIDKLNIKWSKVFGLPLTVKVGRQDLIFGNGWLVLDGTPLDGSRTIFFDAARATLELKEAKTTIDLIYIDQHADSDRWLKPFCDNDFHNMEQNEKGVILYVTNKSIDRVQLDSYFIYKHDERDIGEEPGDVRAGHLAPWQTGTDADIYTFGARIAGAYGEHWKYRAEFANQFGYKNGEDLCALGLNTRLEYHLNDSWKNNFRFGYEYLSGDDPETTKNEQFDPLWGRWPQFSEMLAYTVALENRPGETTNLHRIGFGWTGHPCEKIELCADYHLLFADERNSYRGRPFFSNGNCFRGQLMVARLKYKFNDHISGHAIAEMFFPGEFYSDLNNEVGGFFRYELTFTW